MNDKRTKRTTEPLNRDRAISAAVALADQEGIAGLSMRKLAKSLQIEAMSLYHHVANKDDLLDGMIDSVFAEIELPSLDLDWKPAMVRRSYSLRSALLRHRWAVGLMDSRSSPGMATLRQHDAMIGCCRAAGFAVVGAGHALSLIDSYIYGFVLQEVSLPFGPDDDMGAMVDEIVPAALLAAFPHLAELTTELVMQPGYQYGDEFAFGIELIVNGLLASI